MGHNQIQTTQRYIHLAGKVSHLATAMEKAAHLRPVTESPPKVSGKRAKRRQQHQ